MDMLQRIHSSHLKLKEVSGELVKTYFGLVWPKMLKTLWLNGIPIVLLMTNRGKTPLISHEVPFRPWAKVASDLFRYNSREYLVTVDHYSNFWEIDYLHNTKSKTVIRKLKALFARYVRSLSLTRAGYGHKPSAAFDESTHENIVAYKGKPPCTRSASLKISRKAAD